MKIFKDTLEITNKVFSQAHVLRYHLFEFLIAIAAEGYALPTMRFREDLVIALVADLGLEITYETFKKTNSLVLHSPVGPVSIIINKAPLARLDLEEFDDSN